MENQLTHFVTIYYRYRVGLCTYQALISLIERLRIILDNYNDAEADVCHELLINNFMVSLWLP